MPTLAQLVEIPEKKKAVVADATIMLDEEVASKGGISGLGIKAAFGMVKALKPGIIPEVFAGLLPDFAKNLDPLMLKRKEGEKIAVFLQGHAVEVANALLAVTDGRAKSTKHQTLAKAYGKLRPTGERHIVEGMPRLSKLLEKHLADVVLPVAPTPVA